MCEVGFFADFFCLFQGAFCRGFFFFWWGVEEECFVKEFKILRQQKNSLTTLVFRYNGVIYCLLKPLKMLQWVHKNPNFDIFNFSHAHIIICLILQLSKPRSSILPHSEKRISSWGAQVPNIIKLLKEGCVCIVMGWHGVLEPIHQQVLSK